MSRGWFCLGWHKYFIKKVINVLKQTFSICNEEYETFKYLRLHVRWKAGEVTIQKIKLQIEKSHKEMSHAQLTETGAQQLRMLADQSNWTLYILAFVRAQLSKWRSRPQVPEVFRFLTPHKSPANKILNVS